MVDSSQSLLDGPESGPYHAAFAGNHPLSLEALYAPIAADMRAVDAVIRERLHSDVVLIRQVAEYIIGAGGKRLRPALVLFSAGALGARPRCA